MIKSAFFNIEGDETEEWNACLCISIESDSDGRFLREIIIPITSLGGRNRGGDPMLNREVGAFSHGCLMVNLEPSIAAAVIQFGNERIADGNLAEFGREASPHVTVLYGFSPDVPAADVLAAYQGPATVRFGPVARFSPPGKDYDVLHLTVESPELEAEHQRLRDLFGDEVAPSDYGDYKPHVTLAYVKPGTHPELDGNDEFATKDLVGIGSLSYSQPDGGKAERLLNSGTPCGDSFIAPDKTCHAGQGDKLAVDVPETARMAAVTFKAKDASGTQRTFMVVASKNTRAGARFAYEQNPEAVLAEHQKTFPIPEVEKTFRATLLEVVDEIPRAMFHNSYDSIKDAASRGFDEMLHFAKQVGKMVGGVDERDVQLKNRGEFSFYELMAACDGPVALANSGKPCGESFIADGDTCHVGVTPEQDAAYSEAVKSGDTATAQKMVDEAAKKAGGRDMFHASRGEYESRPKPPYYLASDEEYAQNFGGNVKRITVAPKSVFDLTHIKANADDGGLRLKAELESAGVDTTSLAFFKEDELAQALNRNLKAISERLKAKGFDGVDLNEYVEGGGRDQTHLVLKDSADPITRDAQGNVIPLSKRFDKASSKISNSGEFEESLHPRANDGKFTDGGGESASELPVFVNGNVSIADKLTARFIVDDSEAGRFAVKEIKLFGPDVERREFELNGAKFKAAGMFVSESLRVESDGDATVMAHEVGHANYHWMLSNADYGLHIFANQLATQLENDPEKTQASQNKIFDEWMRPDGTIRSPLNASQKCFNALEAFKNSLLEDADFPTDYARAWRKPPVIDTPAHPGNSTVRQLIKDELGVEKESVTELKTSAHRSVNEAFAEFSAGNSVARMRKRGLLESFEVSAQYDFNKMGSARSRKAFLELSKAIREAAKENK